MIFRNGDTMDNPISTNQEPQKKPILLWAIIGIVVLILLMVIGISLSRTSSDSSKSVSASECDELIQTYDGKLYTVTSGTNKLRGSAALSIDKNASCKVTIQYLFYFYDAFPKNADFTEYLYTANLVDPSAKRQSDEGQVFAITCGPSTDVTAKEAATLSKTYQCPTFQANQPASRFYLSFGRSRATGQKEFIEQAIKGEKTIEVFDLSPYAINEKGADGITTTSYDMDKAIQEGKKVGSYSFTLQ